MGNRLEGGGCPSLGDMDGSSVLGQPRHCARDARQPSSLPINLFSRPVAGSKFGRSTLKVRISKCDQDWILVFPAMLLLPRPSM